MSSVEHAHPAERAARAAMTAASAGDRAAWLAAYADDAALYDPVGGSPLDPDGAGLHGHTALAQFWDLTVAPNDVVFEISAVHPSGREAAIVATVSLTFANGQHVSYDGVFVYAVNDDGRIATMRSYFDLEAVLGSLAQPEQQ